jgi:L-alanine-DL-glutamate epimerase-like enolase superfamily enzyme
VAFVADTRLLSIGAGSRLLAYDVERAGRLWEDTADLGFWHWAVYPNAILMAAELELAAWDLKGRKL